MKSGTFSDYILVHFAPGDLSHRGHSELLWVQILSPRYQTNTSLGYLLSRSTMITVWPMVTIIDWPIVLRVHDLWACYGTKYIWPGEAEEFDWQTGQSRINLVCRVGAFSVGFQLIATALFKVPSRKSRLWISLFCSESKVNLQLHYSASIKQAGQTWILFGQIGTKWDKSGNSLQKLLPTWMSD